MRALVGILHKDLLIEWRARTRGLSLAFFAFVVLLLFSFAVGPDTAALSRQSGAYLWMAVLLSSTLLLSASLQIEVEAGALERLLLTPVPPAALFYGKALANTLQLVLIAALALGVSLVLFDAPRPQDLPVLVGAVTLGAAGLSAPGTLYSALTARVPSRQLLLPLLLFPLVVPVLLAAVKSSSLALLGDPMGQSGSWLALLACFNAIYWSLCGVLFGKVVDL